MDEEVWGGYTIAHHFAKFTSEGPAGSFLPRNLRCAAPRLASFPSTSNGAINGTLTEIQLKLGHFLIPHHRAAATSRERWFRWFSSGCCFFDWWCCSSRCRCVAKGKNRVSFYLLIYGVSHRFYGFSFSFCGESFEEHTQQHNLRHHLRPNGHYLLRTSIGFYVA